MRYKIWQSTGWEWFDDENDPKPMTVHEPEDTWIGLYDAQGHEIHRVREIGFKPR